MRCCVCQERLEPGVTVCIHCGSRDPSNQQKTSSDLAWVFTVITSIYAVGILSLSLNSSFVAL